jgi:hypothetical protein
MVMLVAAVDILSVLNIVTMLHQGGGSVKRQRWAGHQLNDILNLTHIVFLVALVSLCCHLQLFHFAYEITVVVIATLIQTYRWVMGGDRGSQLLLVTVSLRIRNHGGCHCNLNPNLSLGHGRRQRQSAVAGGILRSLPSSRGCRWVCVFRPSLIQGKSSALLQLFTNTCLRCVARPAPHHRTRSVL